MYEWVNSSLVVGRHRGTPGPDQDLEHAPSEAAFRQVEGALDHLCHTLGLTSAA